MNSTSVYGVWRWLAAWLLVLAAAPLFAAETPVPRPPGLERDVQFWIRVYTEVTTNGGFLHDDRNLAVIYEKIEFGSNTSPRERQRLVDDTRNKYIAAVQAYNVSVRSFPNNLTAMMFGYKPKPNFTVDNEKSISTAPKVDFSKPSPQPGAPSTPK